MYEYLKGGVRKIFAQLRSRIPRVKYREFILVRQTDIFDIDQIKNE